MIHTSTSQGRGQLALEFIIMTAFAVIIGMAFLTLTYDTLSDSVERERILAMNEMGYMLQDELILAASVRDGYTRNITIPDRLGRFAYQMNSFEGGLTLTSGPVKITYPVPVVAGTFVMGPNVITKDGGIEIT